MRHLKDISREQWNVRVCRCVCTLHKDLWINILQLTVMFCLSRAAHEKQMALCLITVSHWKLKQLNRFHTLLHNGLALLSYNCLTELFAVPWTFCFCALHMQEEAAKWQHAGEWQLLIQGWRLTLCFPDRDVHRFRSELLDYKWARSRRGKETYRVKRRGHRIECLKFKSLFGNVSALSKFIF